MMRRQKVAIVHIPRTGGTVLGAQLLRQTEASDPTFYFSFVGNDASRGANRVVVERIKKGDDVHRRVLASEHFRASRVICGHFSVDAENLFDEYELTLASVLREPVSRTLSIIYKNSMDTGTHGTFGSQPIPSKTADPPAYWAAIQRILSTYGGDPIPGLESQDNLLMFNAMCHMLGGTPLHTFTKDVPFDRAVENLPRFTLGLFERFNETVGAMMRRLDLPIVLDERSNPRGEGTPTAHTRGPRNYGAPPAVVELVRSLNQPDERLYRHVVDQRLYAT